MKLLSLNQSDIDGGAARAAHRVAAQLIAMGVDLNMQVMRKLGRDAWVLGPRNAFQSLLSRVLPRLDLTAKRLLGVDARFPWSLNLFPNPLLDAEFVNGFDVIHLHWVGKNLLPVNWIRNFRKPVVWTLHDAWAFTGGCHYPADCRHFERGCGHCPQLAKGSEGDISARIWRKKAAVYPGAPFHFVAPSRWIADEARASSLLKGFPVSVIPNGLDTGVFAPRGKAESRKVLNLPGDKKIILFGAMYADTDQRKGMDLLMEALNLLAAGDANFADRHLLAVFGTENRAIAERFPLPVVCLGVIKDEAKLARIYSAADLTVVPSRLESFGQVASESLSCGTPVAAFNATGLRDVVDHLRTGYLAEPFQADDLANGMELILGDSDTARGMPANARRRAIETFDIDVTTRMHLDLFLRLCRDGA